MTVPSLSPMIVRTPRYAVNYVPKASYGVVRFTVEQNELLRQGTYEFALGAISVIASSGKPGTADSARALGKEIILTRMFNFVCCRWSTIWSVTNCSEKISEVRGQRLCKWLMIVCFIRNAKFTHPNIWSPVRRHAV